MANAATKSISAKKPKSRKGGGGRDSRVRVAGECMTILTRRCRYMGWNGGVDSLKRARSPLLGTFLGQLCYTGKLSDLAHDGLATYASAVVRYNRAIGLPKSTPQAQSLQASGGGSVALAFDDDEIAVRVRRAKSAYMAAHGALQAAQADLSVVGILIRDEVQADTFRDAMAWFGERRIERAEHAGQKMADHFGLAF